MALTDLTPAVRGEAILDGADIDPATRLEYFLSKAANEVPKPTGSSDAGKVLTVNEDGDGFILDEVDPGLPDISGVSDAGKIVAVNAAGDGYELVTDDVGLVLTFSGAAETEILNDMATAITACISGNAPYRDVYEIDNVSASEKSTLSQYANAFYNSGMNCILHIAGMALEPVGGNSLANLAYFNYVIPTYQVPNTSYIVRIACTIQYSSSDDIFKVYFTVERII